MLMIDGIISCFSVIASLCVGGTATAELHWGANSSGARFRFHNATVTSTLGSDAVIFPNLREMKEFCRDGSCFFYRGYCGEARRDYRCVLWYTFERSMPLRSIEIRGRRVSVSSALDHLSLVRSNEGIVVLSRLNYNASDDMPPTCYEDSNCPRGRDNDTTITAGAPDRARTRPADRSPPFSDEDRMPSNPTSTTRTPSRSNEHDEQPQF